MKDYPHVRSLDGVGDLFNLTELGVHGARGLENISSLRADLPLLSRLQLSHCRRIPDIDPVVGCAAIEFLDFSECGDIPSVRALTGLTGLDALHLWGSTKVLDGDLRPIASLPNLRDFRMQGRPSYSPSVKEIQDRIKAATEQVAPQRGAPLLPKRTTGLLGRSAKLRPVRHVWLRSG